jgi:hypothetical protein
MTRQMINFAELSKSSHDIWLSSILPRPRLDSNRAMKESGHAVSKTCSAAKPSLQHVGILHVACMNAQAYTR